MKSLKNQKDFFKIINIFPLKKTNLSNQTIKSFSITNNKIIRNNPINNNQLRSIESMKTENKIISINKKNIFGLFKQKSPKVEEQPKAENNSNNENNKGK